MSTCINKQTLLQRLTCVRAGNFWDDRTCSCFCQPQHEWPYCPSGYAFDHSPGICSCVSYTTNAAFVIEIMERRF